MSKAPATLALEVNLEDGVVPISRAASALAALIKRSRERQQPIVVTQKGYPSSVLLPIELYTHLRELAKQAIEASAGAPTDAPSAVEPVVSAVPLSQAAPVDLALVVQKAPPEQPEVLSAPEPRHRRGGRRAKGSPKGT
jgi:prevent-host-death family protein